MKALLFNLNNNDIVMSGPFTVSEVANKKADFIVFLSNYEEMKKEKVIVEKFKKCLSNSCIDKKPEDLMFSITRLVSEQLLTFNIFPNTSTFKYE